MRRATTLEPLRRALRNGAVVDRERARAYSLILLCAYAAVIVWLASGDGLLDPLRRVFGTDFLSFWTVSSFLLSDRGDQVYSGAAIAGAEFAMTGVRDYYAWYYPPIALLVVAPLALLPYLWALAAWTAAGLAAYARVLWGVLPERLSLLAGLAAPAVFLCVTHGQTSLLFAGTLAGGLAVLPRFPVTAGFLFAIAAFKPQLALLVPVALVASRNWRALVAAAAMLVVLLTVTVTAFGPGTWRDWFRITSEARMALESGAVGHFKMQSTFAGLRVLGAGTGLAKAAQVAVTLGCVAVVARIWSRRSDVALRNATLLIAVVLATPFVLDYDLVLLVPGLAWIVGTWQYREALPWERMLVAAAWAQPLVARPLASVGVPTTPLVMGALLLVVVRASAAEVVRAEARPVA